MHFWSELRCRTVQIGWKNILSRWTITRVPLAMYLNLISRIVSVIVRWAAKIWNIWFKCRTFKNGCSQCSCCDRAILWLVNQKIWKNTKFHTEVFRIFYVFTCQDFEGVSLAIRLRSTIIMRFLISKWRIMRLRVTAYLQIYSAPAVQILTELHTSNISMRALDGCHCFLGMLFLIHEIVKRSAIGCHLKLFNSNQCETYSDILVCVLMLCSFASDWVERLVYQNTIERWLDYPIWIQLTSHPYLAANMCSQKENVHLYDVFTPRWN